MNVKQITGWAAVAFTMWWIIQNPSNAQHIVYNTGHVLATAASGFSHFVARI